MVERKPKRTKRVARRGRKPNLAGRVLTIILVIPATYMLAALVGSIVPVNRGWTEPKDGITVYLADNGIHTDIIMPASGAALDWAQVVPKSNAAAVPASAKWVAFGSGEEHVYLETPTWWDIRPRTIWSVLTGSRRVIHAEWVGDPAYAEREIKLRPEEYRRLWAAVRSDFRLGTNGKPILIEHPGYDCCDAFYWAIGRFNALRTCNSWTADKLRIAGVKTSLWPPFADGLLWRYRRLAGA